ncbi:hypothetical protein [Mycobacterium sp.]|uniref:hypothetical protein n=1 Tax=Mycobacterium sp. TaxID=1785 RepID=UPI003C716B10
MVVWVWIGIAFAVVVLVAVAIAAMTVFSSHRKTQRRELATRESKRDDLDVHYRALFDTLLETGTGS